MTHPNKVSAEQSQAADKALKQAKFLRNDGWHIPPQGAWNRVADLVEAGTATLASSLDWLKGRR
jgi:hypothetical protein